VRGFKGPLTVSQFKGGQSNPTYLLTTPARRYVLRRKPPGKLLPSAHAVDREFRAISALYPQGFPVAEPLTYCADESVVGTAYYVMGYADGRVIWEPYMPGASHRAAAVYDTMNATLARLHSFDPAAIGLADFRRGELRRPPGRPLVEAISRLDDAKTSLRWSSVMRWLPEHLPPPARCASSMATIGSTIWCWRAMRRRCSPCSTGSSPRSAIRSRTSRTI
jgi:aminoglycoside phosphotransferase (APT) family kinase protein